MLKRRLMAVPVAAMALAVGGASAASAHSVGVPGTPNCFGTRISHGSSDHGQTPAERAEELGFFVFNVLPPEDRALFMEFFGVERQDDVTVRVMTRFVRINCSDTPIVTP